MLTIKNWVRSKAALFLAATLLLAACAPPGPRALLQGQRLLEQGKYAEAIEKLKTATVLLATNAPAAETAQAWNYLGVACHQAGQVAAAERAYQRALALDKDLTEAHYNLGCLWLEQNRFENARAEFTSYTLRRSTEPEGFVKLGLAELHASETGSPPARARSRLTDAENSFNAARKLSPQNVQALNGLGLVRLYHNQPAEAAQYFSNALKQQPAFAPALLNLAIVAHYYLNQPQVALEKYRQYLALKPTPANAEAVRQALRQLEQATGQPARPPAAPAPAAPPAANPARSATSPKAELENNAPKRSLWQRLFGHTETAALPPASSPAVTNSVPTAVTNSLASEDELPSLPVPSGSRYPYHASGRPVAGNRPEAQRLLARGVQAQGARRWSEAIQAYRAATQADPGFFDAYYNLGLAASAAGELRLALAASENALVLQPESRDARYNFALALRQGNYPTDAANELEKLLAYSPNEARAHLALANLYAQQFRQPAKARPHYQRVLELDPHNKQADNIRYWLVQNR